MMDVPAEGGHRPEILASDQVSIRPQEQLLEPVELVVVRRRLRLAARALQERPRCCGFTYDYVPSTTGARPRPTSQPARGEAAEKLAELSQLVDHMGEASTCAQQANLGLIP